ncbi:MAG: hypothetical protein GF353_07425 [Candidatus Lokiarchaeota archaeon]|nr:hypothetical protein [Candidatus Lokiarchaeota archaeon]
MLYALPDFGKVTGNLDSITPMELYEERIKREDAETGYPEKVLALLYAWLTPNARPNCLLNQCGVKFYHTCLVGNFGYARPLVAIILRG